MGDSADTAAAVGQTLGATLPASSAPPPVSLHADSAPPPSTAPTLSGSAAPLTVADDSLNLHFLMYASLDVCEERVLQLAAAGEAASAHRLSATAAAEQHHLDHLLQMSGFRTYGYVSSSKVFVIVATSGEPPREVIRGLCAETSSRVSTALCAPFRQPGEDLGKCRGFENGMRGMLRQYLPR